MLCDICHFEIDGKPVTVTRPVEYEARVERLALCKECADGLKKDGE
jgi:hypothetical protein